MPVGVCVPIEGMDVLENGLKSLRRSRMMTLREFKDMFGAIERHHRDLKLAHLTGKTKDLMDQAERDTKFYHILVKMLCEVKEVRTGKQQESLRKVYTWYLANKHVLHSGPHFGKSYQKKEAQEVLKKAVTPRNPPPSRDKHRSISQQSSAKSSRKQQSSMTNGHTDHVGRTPPLNQPTSPNHDSPSVKATLSQEGDFSDTEMDLDFSKTPVNDDDGLDDRLIAELQSGLNTLGNVDYRCETPTVRITPLREQSSNTPHSRSGLPRRMVHSVASMVNPHASHSLTLSPQGNNSGHLDHRPTTAPALREDVLQSWRNYNMDIAYGQDVISKLNFVGRSGTMCDVRYTAHEQGEMPELNTRHYLQGIPVKRQGVSQNENHLLSQTLEEFYQTTDAYYPSKLPKYRPVKQKQDDTNKPKSVPAGRKASGPVQLGRDLLQYERQDWGADGDTNVRLDTVVGLIDTVSDSMAAHREVVAPRPHPGFRQPSATGIPSTPVVSRPATSRSGRHSSRQHSRQQSPTARSNTPVSQTSRSRLVPSPTDEILMQDPVCEDRSVSAAPSRSASAVDWRGKITPNSVRYKWGKTKFGGHTYIKNLQHSRSLRSAGSTSAGSRPKTAPSTTKKKIEKPNDAHQRIAQAASHTTVAMDQQELDSMMIIQHLLGSSDSRRDSFGSMFAFDDEFFKNIRNCSPGSMMGTSPALEYLSFVTSTQGGATQSEAIAAVGIDNRRPERDGTIGSSNDQLLLSSIGPSSQVHLPQSNVSVSSGADLDQADLDEDLQNLSEDNQEGELTQTNHSEEPEDKTAEAIAAATSLDKEPEKIVLSLPVDGPATNDEEEAVQVAVTSVPAAGGGPVHPHHRQAPLQVLTESHTWSFTPGAEEDTDDSMKDKDTDIRLKTAFARYRSTSEHHTETSFRPGTVPEVPSSRMTSKVTRSAGRMPGQTVSGHPVRTSRKTNELFKRAPPIRTPPSIPTPYNPYGGRSPRGSNVYNKELESHARKARSPRHYMEHDSQESLSSQALAVRDLRQSSAPRSAPPVLTKTVDPELLESLQVCRLPTREKTVVITSDAEIDGPPSILKASDNGDGLVREVSDYEKQVKFGGAAQFDEDRDIEPQDEKEDAEVETVRKSLSRTDSGLSSKQGSVPSTPLTKQSLSRMGRPIAHYQNVPDPDELSKAVQLQREAAAAVDIQRIFRGYVARDAYKKLLSKERQRLEDEQRAKLDSRRMHREHVARTKAIYNRERNVDDITWQQDYKSVKEEKERERQQKMESIARENAYNQHVSNSTISVIGPHVDIYQVYHPKKTGPSMKEFNNFALMIQKHIRGWLVRRRLEKLKRKAVWSGCSFERMVKDYKTMLAKVQRQHGRDRPKTPFTFREMNEYMDLRRRYESVFEKKAFGGELELEELDQFFKECDLYPSQAELEEAIDVMFRGRGLKGRGLKKREVLDIVFYVYVPKATGLENTRTSTWMNPIIDGVEARRLLGSEAVEPAPLEVCAKLVISSKRERRERENRALREEIGEKSGDDSSDDSEEGEQRRLTKAKLKTVTIVNKGEKQA